MSPVTADTQPRVLPDYSEEGAEVSNWKTSVSLGPVTRATVCLLIIRISHFVPYSFCQWSDKPWEIFTLSQRKSSQPRRVKGAGGGHSVKDE